jgi:hypothetical protein
MIQSKLSETPEYSEPLPYAFVPLPKFKVGEMDDLSKTLSEARPIFKSQIDGVLFFEPNYFYKEGANPCCLWSTLDVIQSVLPTLQLSPEVLSLQRIKQERMFVDGDNNNKAGHNKKGYNNNNNNKPKQSQGGWRNDKKKQSSNGAAAATAAASEADEMDDWRVRK